MSLTESIIEVKQILKSVVKKITIGEKRREAAAEIALEYGRGGQTFVANELMMSRNTIRKGIKEINSGEKIEDRFDLRGRKKTTEKLPELEAQIEAILAPQSQADSKFQTDRLYTNISIDEIRKQLVSQNEYTDEQLPTNRTLTTIVNEMGYTVRAIKKTEPKKKVPETDLIFENIHNLRDEAAQNDNIVHWSADTKNAVKIGEFSRGGSSRADIRAYDHDFGDEKIIPFGIMDVKEKTTDIYLSETKVTADFMVDMIGHKWEADGYLNSGKMLLLNMDNGPENSSRRTELIKRMVEFSVDTNTEVMLAYYPPYHSKYNPIERVWGVLEKHWNGSLLDTKETVKKFIETATYDKINLSAEIISGVYETGIKLNKKTMEIYEKALTRFQGLENWFVHISPKKCIEVLPYNFCYC